MDDLISRRAAIDALAKFVPYAICDESTESYTNGLTDAYNLICQLPSAQPDPHWIPCSERLPEEGNKSYWICTDGGYQCECRWTNVNHFWTNLTTDWHWHIMDVPQYSKVVAWMPLPEPYREGEQDE